MLRLTGILVGSALAIALLLLTLGTPQLSSTDVTPAPEREAPEVLAEVAIAAPDMASPGADVAEQPAASVEPFRDENANPGDETQPDAALVDQLFAQEEAREIVLPTVPDAAVEEHWYAFWSPFRSEIAANGFVAKLQESTGIDYRVVKVKTGVYEVAFAYTDDADIEAKLARISGATGLELSGS
jgi:hypothetical protein